MTVCSLDFAFLSARFSLSDFPDFFDMDLRGDLSDIIGPSIGNLNGPDASTVRHIQLVPAAVVVGAGSGDFERWDHCSQITSEGLDRPRLMSVVLAPQAPITEMVRTRDLVTNADLQRSRTNAATGETKSCNPKMESVEDFDSVNFP